MEVSEAETNNSHWDVSIAQAHIITISFETWAKKHSPIFSSSLHWSRERYLCFPFSTSTVILVMLCKAAFEVIVSQRTSWSLLARSSSQISSNLGTATSKSRKTWIHSSFLLTRSKLLKLLGLQIPYLLSENEDSLHRVLRELDGMTSPQHWGHWARCHAQEPFSGEASSPSRGEKLEGRVFNPNGLHSGKPVNCPDHFLLLPLVV